MVSRRVTFKARRVEDAIKFINTYLDRVKARQVYVNYRGGRIEVKIEGNPTAAKVSSVEAHKVYGTLKQGRVINTYDLTVVFQGVELKSPVPPDTIELTLRLMGYRAELSGSRLSTNASLGKVMDVVKGLSEAYHEMADMDISSNAKRIIAPLAVARGISVYDAIDELVEAGVLSRGRVNGRDYVTLKVDLEGAINILESAMRGRVNSR